MIPEYSVTLSEKLDDFLNQNSVWHDMMLCADRQKVAINQNSLGYFGFFDLLFSLGNEFRNYKEGNVKGHQKIENIMECGGLHKTHH